MAAMLLKSTFPLSLAQVLMYAAVCSALLVSGCGGTTTTATGPSADAPDTTPVNSPTITSPSPGAPAPTPASSPTSSRPAPLPIGPPETPQQLLVKLFGGEQAFEIFLGPKTVQAYRLNGHNRVSPPAKGIDGYEILSGPVAVSEEHAGELKKILTDPDIYDWDPHPGIKGCEFAPGVALIYASEKGSLDVLLCFGCDQIRTYQNGKIVGGKDFDKVRAAIVAVVKKMFPDDAEIQAIPLQKHSPKAKS
jgi:hypothetical protein